MSQRIVLSVLCASLAACAPSAQPVAFDVDQMTWEEVQAHVDIRADNPWPIDLTILRVQYDIRVGDDIVATGALDAPQVVPAGGRHRVALPITIDTRATLDALNGSAEAVSAGATTDAVVSGEVVFDTPFGPMPVPIETGDQVPLLTEPALRRPTVQLKDMNLRKGTLKLVVGVTVHNPNPIDLTARQVDYGASVAGHSILKGEQAEVVLSADSESTLRFPVRVDVGALGRGAVDALQSGRISGDVWLSGRVQTPWRPLPLDLRRSGAIQVW